MSVFSVMGRIQAELRLRRWLSRIHQACTGLLAPIAWRVRKLRFLLQFKEDNQLLEDIRKVNEGDQPPYFLFWLPEELGDAESMTMPELAYEIEKQEFTLLCLKAVEFGKEGTEKPFNWRDALDQTIEALQKLRLILEQRMDEALGTQEDEFLCEDDQPEEFRDHGLTTWAASSELKSTDDTLACWHLSDCFPFGLSFEKLQLAEQTLKAQIEALEAEEAAYEERNALDFWRFRMDIRAEQLEQIQTTLYQHDWDCDS